VKSPIGFIPSWPRSINVVSPAISDGGEMVVVPAGPVLGIDSYWYQPDDDSEISRARRYLRNLHDPVREPDDDVAPPHIDLD